MIQNFNEDGVLTNLVKSDLPSNVSGARNPDGFTQVAETDHFADSGMQILKPKTDKEPSPVPEGDTTDPLWVKEEDDHFVSSPVEKSAPDSFVRTDTDNPAYEDRDSFEPSEDVDFNSLMERWKQAGLPEKDFPADAIDFDGPQASIIASTIMEQVYMAEIFGKYDQEIDLVTPEKGKEIDVAIRVDRIGNHRVNKALTELSKENKNYVESVWEDTTNVDVLINPEEDGQTMIVMRAKKDQEKGERFIGMSFEDFSKMLSVPSVRDGNSRINLPQVHLDNQKELIDFITAIYGIKINGKLVGGDGVPRFNVKKWTPLYKGK